MDELKTKICTKCGEEKPATAEFFYISRGRFRAKCKMCFLAERKERYMKDGERERESNAKWRAKNPEKVKGYQQKWLLKNIEKSRASSRRWIAANPERHKAYNKKWVSENKELVKEYKQKWLNNNSERYKELKQKWASENPNYYKLDRDNLSDRYIKDLMRKQTGIHNSHITQGIIEAKRQTIKIKRLCRTSQN